MAKATQEKLEATAIAYLTNGFIKSLALQTAGYSKNYAEHCGLKLFENDRLKAIIAQKQQKLALKTEITAEYVLAGIKAIADNESTSAQEKLRAFELLGKKLALWIEKTQERRITEYVPVSIEDEAQLLRRREVRCAEVQGVAGGIDGVEADMNT